MNIPFLTKEKRGEVPSGSVPQSAANFIEIISGMNGGLSSTGIPVSIDKAMTVPAFGAAWDRRHVGFYPVPTQPGRFPV